MRRDTTARKCFVQLVGNRKLVGDMAREQPSLPASEFVSFQNYVGLRGWTRTGRPYPAFHGMRKSSTCAFDFANCGMLGGSRPGPVNRHGFEFAGRAGARLAPIMGPAPAGRPLSGWRPALRKRITASAGFEMSQGRRGGGRRQRRRPRGAPRGPDRASRAPRSWGPSRIRAPAAESFPKLSLHRRGGSRIVLLRTGA